MTGTALLETVNFVSFDGGFKAQSEVQRPDDYRLIETDLGDRPRIARGGGYSYAAASFGAGSLVHDMTRFNRVVRFDPAAQLIEVEAGMTLGDLLNLTVPAGLWLPVQPGYPAITVGGCIAANVHGKNPALSGTFIRYITDLKLFHPKHGTLEASPTANSSVFDLTCGGYGLTGVILTATLQLESLPGSKLSMQRTPVRSLAEALALVRASGGRKAFTYTWHDAAPSARTFGRGFVYEGSFVPGTSSRASLPPRYRLLTAASRARIPVSVWNRLTTRALNSLYWHWELVRPKRADLPLFDSLFPFARRPEIFAFFGRRGFAEYQVLVPDRQVDGFLGEIQKRIIKTDAPAVLLSFKLFKGDQRLLRFEGDGVCVTLYLARSRAGLAFLPILDQLTTETGSIPNIIKDSRLPYPMVQACYPQYEAFRELLRAYDPARLFRSELSERLRL